ncbi:hypothetical protein LINPERPRIM_LOCUS38779 [Linum perenne]
MAGGSRFIPHKHIISFILS